MTTKDNGYRRSAGYRHSAALLIAMLLATPLFAQDLFEEQEKKPPLTEEQKAAGERESIF